MTGSGSLVVSSNIFAIFTALFVLLLIFLRYSTAVSSDCHFALRLLVNIRIIIIIINDRDLYIRHRSCYGGACGVSLRCPPPQMLMHHGFATRHHRTLSKQSGKIREMVEAPAGLFLSAQIPPGFQFFKNIFSELTVAASTECYRVCFLFRMCVCWENRIKGAEARRRITFFVNSLFVEQPKPSRVLQMPSLTTLTPYYNEDVVSAM